MGVHSGDAGQPTRPVPWERPKVLKDRRRRSVGEILRRSGGDEPGQPATSCLAVPGEPLVLSSGRGAKSAARRGRRLVGGEPLSRRDAGGGWCGPLAERERRGDLRAGSAD